MFNTVTDIPDIQQVHARVLLTKTYHDEVCDCDSKRLYVQSFLIGYDRDYYRNKIEFHYELVIYCSDCDSPLDSMSYYKSFNSETFEVNMLVVDIETRARILLRDYELNCDLVASQQADNKTSIMTECWSNMHLAWMALNSAGDQLAKLPSDEPNPFIRNQHDHAIKIVESVMDNIKDVYFVGDPNIPLVKDCSKDWREEWKK